MSARVVAVRELVAGYGGPPVLRGVSLEVAAGEFVGVTGPNAAGKSTLIRAISGVIRARAGAVEVDGRPVAAYSRRELARVVAVAPQETHLAGLFTVAEVVLMGRYAHIRGWAGEGPADLAAAAAAMAVTGVGVLADRYFSDLSGGERQRVVLARALAQEPRVLLLDEPTAHLDVRYQMELLEAVRRACRERGLAVVAALHDLNLAALYADRLLLVAGGEMVAAGAPEAVLTEANILRAYGVRARVGRHPEAGRPHVTVLAGGAGAGRDARE